MLFERLTKDNVYYHLLNFGKNRWLDSRYFYNVLVERCDFTDTQDLVKLKSFQRSLADIVQQINVDQMTYEKFVIVSCDSGYKIAQTEEEFMRGYNYIYSKIDEPLKRMKFIDKMRIKTVYGKEQEATEDLFTKLVG